jgi:hypothetical protein
MRAVAIFQRLPELLKRLDRVEKQIAAISETKSAHGRDGDRK